jgi:hypothetical protein
VDLSGLVPAADAGQNGAREPRIDRLRRDATVNEPVPGAYDAAVIAYPHLPAQGGGGRSAVDPRGAAEASRGDGDAD